MTQDEIIRMARECGGIADDQTIVLYHEELERFFNIAFAAGAAAERNRHAWTQEHWTQYEHAIAAAEREACAKVCEEVGPKEGSLKLITESFVAAIRARGEKNV